MNFDFLKDVPPQEGGLAGLYDKLTGKLGEAEQLYYADQAACGQALREGALIVCQIYNAHYDIGFPDDATLNDYLCYTGERSDNVMVSRFLSVVRSEQRDRLEWLRVRGDECANGGDAADGDHMYLTVKKMMVGMLETAKELCEKAESMTGLDGLVFREDILPGYRPPEDASDTRRGWRRRRK